MTTADPRRRAHSPPPPVSDAAARYASGLVDAAASIRLSALFGARTAERVLYRSRARSGIQVIAIETHALSHEELVSIMRYRLAQYLAVHFVDLERVFAERIEYEPLDHTSPHDVHVIAADARSGEILCYVTIKSLKHAPSGATLRSRERPLFPVEEVHGWGIFNRLDVIPDIPVERIREVGRFVKNQRYAPRDARSIRAPIETSLALWRVIEHELQPGVDACVGDLEEGIAQAHMEFFHVPMAVLHGTVPYEPETAWLYRRYRHRTVFPFAVLVADFPLAHARNRAIDRALSLPGRLAFLRLQQLRKATSPPRSTLQPEEGLPAIDEALVLSQPDVDMSRRLALIEDGNRLRSAPLFAGLSVAESAVLATLADRMRVEAGTVVLREGEDGDAIYVVDSGHLDVMKSGAKIGELGPGDHFGEIALVTGNARMADVVAATDVVLVRLRREAYLGYLARLPEVTAQTMASTAARLAAARASAFEK